MYLSQAAGQVEISYVTFLQVSIFPTTLLS